MKNQDDKQTKKSFFLKGHVIFTPELGKLSIHENHYLYCMGGKAAGIFKAVPESLRTVEVHDYTDKLILPGLADLHLHASQFVFRGMGMDVQLLDWLEAYAFPEESRFEDPAYAREIYSRFVAELLKTPTTRAVIFATVHAQASECLMELLDEAGLGGFVGKVNMDRNAPEGLRETAQGSLRDTEEWIRRTKDKFVRVKPMITPRFVPSCTGELMRGLGLLSEQYHVPVQSHLSENLDEIEWVKALHPGHTDYGDVYKEYNLFGGAQACVMAHCNYSTDDELRMMKERGVIAVHCPHSNANVSTEIAPVRRILNQGVRVGMGTDIAGGDTMNLFRTMGGAIQMSKLRWLASGKTEKPLTVREALYMASKGGGSIFGRVGSFEDGYELDAVVIDDCGLGLTERFTLEQRLERAVYLTDDRHIKAKYVAGKKLPSII